ncbi:MAG: hypothetical protein K6G50_13755 [bacterium]|nr:hypothetical protein [bacterium]
MFLYNAFRKQEQEKGSSGEEKPGKKSGDDKRGKGKRGRKAREEALSLD